MDRYKILHIITRFDKGGSAENTCLTLIGLDKKRYELTLIMGTCSGFHVSREEMAENEKNLERLKKAGVKIISVNTLIRAVNPIADILTFIRFFLIIWKGGYHIVHTHTSKAGFIGRWAAFFAHIPIIVHTPHGHAFTGYFNRIMTSVLLCLERVTAFITDRIITLTNKCKEEHIGFKIAAPEKFATIHSGIETDRFNISIDISAKKRELNILEGHLIVGTVGRLVPVKGHKYLVEAAKQVLEQIPEVQFVFAGDGSLKTELEAQARFLGIRHKLNFLGWTNNVPEIMALFDLFVLPSLNEGMGKVLVEAMLLGKPVVASKAGGIPDLVKDGDNGLLVAVADSKGLSESIINLLMDKTTRKKMGAKGKIIASFYSSSRMVELIEGLYDELLRSSSGI